jgi:hypothetical protein
VWFESPIINAPQAEACATQDLLTPQRESTQQPDIAENICHAFVRYRLIHCYLLLRIDNRVS